MGTQGGKVDHLVARLASAAHGVVSRPELLSAGVTHRQIRRRLERGTLIREFRGVYRVGHRAPSVEARYLAAVKACGEGSVLAGRAAAWLFGLTRGPVPRQAWEQDRERERAARARGDEFRRLTWRDVVEEPGPTVSELRALLYADGSSRSLPVVRRP
jgi:Transcriptional regulator, AbiEi antitoxin